MTLLASFFHLSLKHIYNNITYDRLVQNTHVHDMYVYIIFVFVCVHSGRGEVQGRHQGCGSTESAADTTDVYWRI